MRSLKHIELITQMNGLTVDYAAIKYFLSKIQADIKAEKITHAKDDYCKEVMRIQKSLVGMINAWPVDPETKKHEPIKVWLDPARKNHYNSILKKQGLGIIPILVGAAAGKLFEHHVVKFFSKDKKGLAGIGTYSLIDTKKKRAKKKKKKKSTNFGFGGPQKSAKRKQGLTGKKTSGKRPKRPVKKVTKRATNTPKNRKPTMRKKSYDKAYEKFYAELLDKNLSISDFLKQHEKWINENAPKFNIPLGSIDFAGKNESINDHYKRSELVEAAVAEVVKVEEKPPVTNSSNWKDTMSASEMGAMTYEELSFVDDDYKRIFGSPASNFDMCIDGEPGAGKTVFLLKLANYLADNHGPVLYITTEEFGSATLIKKVKEFNITSPNITFKKRMPPAKEYKEFKNYKFIFIDSINHARITIEDYQKLREETPNSAFILILQQTKGGQHKGSNDWPHEVEITMTLYMNEFNERWLNIHKDRYGSPRRVKI